MHCEEAVADPVLWAAVSISDGSPFPQICEMACVCTNVGDARAGREEGWQGEAFVDGRWGTHVEGEVAESSSGDDGANEVKAPGGGDAAPQYAAPVAGVQNQCGGNCTGSGGCGDASSKGCMCLTQSEQYQPGEGTVAFVAACVVSLGGKRQEGRPCPCNGTYVSHACCGARDGLVWEGEEFKLGELVGEG